MTEKTSQQPEIPGLEVTDSTEYHLLPVDDRARLALASTKTEEDLKALALKHQSITEIKDKAGREQAHGAAMELMRARTTIVNVSKAARDDATKFSRAVISEEQRLIAIIEAEEKRLKDLRDAYDAEQARLKREAEERERQRLLAIAGRINEIKGYATMAAQCRTSERVQALIDKLTAMEITGFDEFEKDANLSKSMALTAMGTTLRNKQEAEAEAKRLADTRAAQERVRLEQEERQRQLDAQAAELARQQKAIDDANRAAEAPRPAAPEFGVNLTIQPNEAEKNIAARSALDAVAQAPQVLAPETAAIPIVQLIHPEYDMAAELRGNGEAMPPGVPLIKGEIGVVDCGFAFNPSSRPSDEVIIGALALRFRVRESKVIEWLQDMDLEIASKHLAG